MNRRDFALAAALFPAFSLLAQQPARRYRIGTLTAAWASNHPAVEGLRTGLAGLGMIEGRDVVFVHRYTEGDLAALPGAAAALVASGVDLIFTAAENATLAAVQTTRDVPIVFANVGDPVASGIVRDLAHPGGNITGISNLATELGSKRLQLLKELAPKLRRVWAIYEANTSESRVSVHRLREAARVLKLELLERPVRTAQELGAVLADVLPGDGYFVISSGGTSLDLGNQILKTALPAKALTTFDSPFWVDWGALMAYGADFHAVGVQAARQVAKILMGTPPRDVPVEGANKLQLVINAKVAKALGLKIPQSILLRADRLVE